MRNLLFVLSILSLVVAQYEEWLLMELLTRREKVNCVPIGKCLNCVSNKLVEHKGRRMRCRKTRSAAKRDGFRRTSASDCSFRSLWVSHRVDGEERESYITVGDSSFASSL